MPASRQCLGCRRLTKGGSYCRACSVKRERVRLKKAPWTKLYDLKEWNATKWAVHKRDGYRCTHLTPFGRCRATKQTTVIEAHHVIKLRVLYDQAKGDWARFLLLALDRSNLVTLCLRHHHEADRRPARVPLSQARKRPPVRRRKVRRR